jgi:mannan endo-1,4-beta-mannosidase
MVKQNINKVLKFGISGMILINSMVCYGDTIRLEAENAALTGVNPATALTGYSGTGYVSGFDADGDKITFTFDATAGIYELFIGYCTPSGQKGYDLAVNGSNSTGMFPASGSFQVISSGKVLLVSGQNTIIIGRGWGWFYIDYISLVPAVTYPPEKPLHELTDTLATGDAKELYKFLVGLYGKKILSGQHSLPDLQYIKTITGHTPVVAGFDLIEYSPSRIEYGSNPEGSAESWIEWEQAQGCIINLLWHWNAPADLINTTGKEWWRGFYTEATTFNIAAVLGDTASAKYDLVIRDIDAIAVQLKKFSDNGIPVLWRPLHEASGGWFWWGAQGPGPFIELWRLMYNRLVNYHQLHNLIWVYTSGDPDWYPGDGYVDIASLDIYSANGASMSADWENVQAEFNGKKLVALSESGTLPVPDKVRLFNTWWSWFALWQGDFIRNADQDELIAVYQDNDILTMEKIGNWRTFSAIPDAHVVAKPAEEIKVFYNQVNESVFLNYSFEFNCRYTIQVFNMPGQLIYRQSNIPVNANTGKVEIQTGRLSGGAYIVMVSNGMSLLAGKLIISE